MSNLGAGKVSAGVSGKAGCRRTRSDAHGEYLMEKYKSPDFRIGDKSDRSERSIEEILSETSEETQKTALAHEIIRRLQADREKTAKRRKWGGRALIVFGGITLLGSCPFYAFSLIPGQTIAAGVAVMSAGLALMAGGGVLSTWRPRLKDTNEALIVALKYGNQLTTSRLALELDVSFDKAEKIIQELVRRGVAEIDLDYQDPDHSIVYKIKGL